MSNLSTKILGTVAPVPKGEYNPETYYEYLNIVTYNSSSYIALQSCQGIEPTDKTCWELLGGGLKREDIIDNLESNDSYKMLSAKQGKILNEKINNYINVKNYGVKGDGITDDTEAIQNCIDSNPNKTIYFPDGTYLVSDSIITPASNSKAVNLKLSDYAVVKASQNFSSQENYVIVLGGGDKTNYTRYNIGSSFGIEGGVVDCNSITNGIKYAYGVGGYIKDIEVRKCIVGIYVPVGTNVSSNDINVECVDIYGINEPNSIGLIVDGSDNYFSTIRTFHTHKGVVVNGGGNHFSKIHCLLSLYNYENYNNTIGFEIDAWNNIFEFCYSDQFSTAFYVKNNKMNFFSNPWAYFYDDYDSDDYNHTAFKFNNKFSAIIKELFVNFYSSRGTNKVLDIDIEGGSGRLYDLTISHQNYLTSENDDCFSPLYNKSTIKLYSNKLSNVEGTLSQFNVSASENIINLNLIFTGLNLTANTNQILCTLPKGYYNENADVDLVCVLGSTNNTFKFNCWIQHTTGNIVIVSNNNLSTSSKVVIKGSYHIL